MALLSLPGLAAQCAEPKRVAVLDVELLKADYLPDPHRVTPEERRRLDMVADLIRDRQRAEGYAPVPAAQTRAAIQAADPGVRLMGHLPKGLHETGRVARCYSGQTISPDGTRGATRPRAAPKPAAVRH